MPASLSAIPGLSRGHWRDTSPTLPSGHDALDAQLPGGGWPLGAVSEILSDGRPGEGLGLLLPSLAHLTQAGRWVALLDPPWRPYAPALAHAGLDLRHVIVVRSPAPRTALWTCEQLLRDLAGGAVLAWPLESPGFGPLRRLQLAAAGGRQAGFLFRPAGAARSPSPAALRLQLEAREGRLRA
ncbi:MAG: translesion DNA synthesis-associated protein ImuA, partial [Xanthomonadales bacterium]|nr:translesion DNA synthesis-associated protein ImuA [Xanthomonadales bacterium]